MKRILRWIAIAIALLTAPLGAQTATDTLSLTILGDMTVVSIQVPINIGNLKVGDTITFVAKAVNQSGVEVNAILSWRTWTVGCAAAPCSQAMVIDAATGFATAIRMTAPGERVILEVTATQVDGMVWGWIEGTGLPINPPPIRQLVVGEAVQLCAYAVRRLSVVGGNPGSPGYLCPPAPVGFSSGMPSSDFFWTAARSGPVIPTRFFTGD